MPSFLPFGGVNSINLFCSIMFYSDNMPTQLAEYSEIL